MGNQEINSEAPVAEPVPTPTAAFADEVDTNTSAKFTAEDLTKARAQEKAKVYPQVEKLQEELSLLKKEREEAKALEAQREAERAAKRAEREQAKKAQLEDEMNVKDLLKAKESEWEKKLEAERQERERAFAILEREREYNELSAFRNQRIEQERDSIIPQLIDLVSGNSRDEIEQSILGLKERSAKIFEDVASANQQARKQMVGASITAPSSGPLDNDSAQSSYSPNDISNMSLADYAKNRAKLLGTASNNRGQGLFG